MLLSKCRLSNNRLSNCLLSKQTLGNFYLDGPVYGPPPPPSWDEYTKTMLHMNGTDASTTFTDEILKTWTAYGNAQIDTAQSKFGGASGYFDGTGDYIDTPYGEDFNVGSGDFTIDFWIKRGTLGTTQRFSGQSGTTISGINTSWYLMFLADNKILATVYDGTTAKQITSSITIADTNWHHIAFLRNINTLQLYIDGIQSGTVSLTGVTINSSTKKISIGRIGEYSSDYFTGWIDEFRFSKGIARWTSNFTPPTSEYTVV